MSKVRNARVSSRQAKIAPKNTKAVGKRAALTPKERANLVGDAARLAIELHRDALKELERY